MFYTTNHRQKRSFLKVLGENFLCFLKYLQNYFQNRDKLKTVLFYPQFPSRSTVAYKISRSLGFNITNNPKVNHHLAIYWDDTTYRKVDEKLLEIASKEKVVNFNCRDISKSKVEKVFYEVFGYSYSVDCRSFTGLMVKKNEKNAAHDGLIIQGPIEPEQGYIYQRIINNTYEDELVVDMRVPIINGNIPFVFLKYKPISKRFAHFRKAKQKLKVPEGFPPEAKLSPEEISNITLYCQKMGLDYGEIDVLRDNDDKKIYIVDVNNTPNGPSVGKLKKQTVKTLARVFKNEFFQ